MSVKIVAESEARNATLEEAALCAWNVAMDYCKRRRVNPGERNDLFLACAAIRSLKTTNQGESK